MSSVERAYWVRYCNSNSNPHIGCGLELGSVSDQTLRPRWSDYNNIVYLSVKPRHGKVSQVVGRWKRRIVGRRRLACFFIVLHTDTTAAWTHTRDSEWQWHQLGHMQVCTSLQTDNHASTPPLSFLQAGCPTNSVKALKELKKKKRFI